MCVTPEVTSQCDEEVEDCGPDPEHGENTHMCRIWASWGVGWSNDLTVSGYFACLYATYFELEIAMQLVEYGGLEGGVYSTVYTQKKEFEHETKNLIEEDRECEPGRWYRAWVFGRFWYKGGGTVWSATALDGRLVQCPAHLDGPGYPS
jgi:hypothetical protein